ncbi:MAG: hypothetical protein M3348_19220, partial [Acidobacteriota bacterium]|nr:hypothetical protein [Acidobacteriota bacterium]
MIDDEGEFGVANPRIVPPFVIVVAAVTLPVTRLELFKVTPDAVERTSPYTFAPSIETAPLLIRIAALPLLPAPYCPFAESKLSMSAGVEPIETPSR